MDVSKLGSISEWQLGRKLGRAKRDLVSQQASNTRTEQELKEGKRHARDLTARIHLLGNEISRRVEDIDSSHGEAEHGDQPDS
jgi:hypothetical protein